MPHTKITYRERGQGQPLLLLHGYGGSVHHWEDVANSLSSTYRVVVPNLGHLYLSTDKMTFSKQVEVLAKFIRVHFPNEKVHLAGLSFGGAIVWALSNEYPELVEKCTLINPMVVDPMKNFLPLEIRIFFGLPLNIKAIYFILSTPMGRAFLKKTALIFRDERSEGASAIEHLRGRKLQFVAYMIHNFIWVLRGENWPQWRQKTLSCFVQAGKCRVIYDKDDLLFAEEAYQHFITHIGCTDVIALTGAGHLASKTCPDLISKYIHEFIKAEDAA
jgi:pimeloyl-ACP methyl ester carboxylesterase